MKVLFSKKTNQYTSIGKELNSDDLSLYKRDISYVDDAMTLEELKSLHPDLNIDDLDFRHIAIVEVGPEFPGVEHSYRDNVIVDLGGVSVEAYVKRTIVTYGYVGYDMEIVSAPCRRLYNVPYDAVSAKP